MNTESMISASTEPRVSVVIPCYNQGRFVGQNIDSLLAQTYPNVEIVLVDDGSTDDTRQVAAGYGDRIRYIHKANAGLSAARNTGILAATGEFIQFLDSDDYLRPDMLAHQMAAAVARPDCHVFNSSWEDVTIDDQLIEKKPARLFSRDVFHTLLATVDAGPPCCYMVRKAALANVGLFDTQLKSQEDLDMWLRLAAAGYEFIPVEKAVAVYRVYPGSMSRNFETMYRSAIAVMNKCRSYHPRCRACRKAIGQGLRRQRGNCFGRALKHDLVACAADGRWGDGFRKARRAVVQNPVFFGYLLRESFQHVFRKRHAAHPLPA